MNKLTAKQRELFEAGFIAGDAHARSTEPPYSIEEACAEALASDESPEPGLTVEQFLARRAAE